MTRFLFALACVCASVGGRVQASALVGANAAPACVSPIADADVVESCWYARVTGLAPARERVAKGALASVTLASLSSGLDFDIASLFKSVRVNAGETGGGRDSNGFDDDGNGYIDDAYGIDAQGGARVPWDSRLSLGTFTTSLWAASESPAFGRGDFFRGLVPGVFLVPVRVLDENGLSSLATVRAGLHYAALRGVQIAHIDLTYQTSDGALLCDEIRVAGLLGTLVIAPAGNFGALVGERDFPASCRAKNLIVVAASNRDRALANYSAFGAFDVDIAAPGDDIFALDMNRHVMRRSGTGPASALVAAAAALVAATYPKETPAQWKEHLVRGATVSSALEGKVRSAGILNAVKALAPLE